MYKKIITALILILSITSLSAQISTDRPSISDSSTIIEKGNFQIEAGVTTQNDLYSYFQSTRFGLFKNMEIRVGFDDHVFEKNNTILVGLKTNVYSDLTSLVTNLSVLVETDVTDVENFTVGRLIADFDLIKGLDITANVGYQYSKINEEYPFSLVMSPKFDSNWGAYAEVYGNMEYIDSTKWNVGVLYTLNKRSQLDISGGTSFQTLRHPYFSLGYSINI